MKVCLHRLRGIGDQQFEVGFRIPRHRPSRLQTQEAPDPVFVGAASTAAKLLIKVDVTDYAPACFCGLINLQNTSHFVRAHYLVLVQQENRNPGGVYELFNLASSASVGIQGALGSGAVADSVCFIADKNIEFVLFCGTKIEEVTEEFGDAFVLLTDDVAKGGGEGLGAGGMDDVPSVSAEVAHEV